LAAGSAYLPPNFENTASLLAVPASFNQSSHCRYQHFAPKNKRCAKQEWLLNRASFGKRSPGETKQHRRKCRATSIRDQRLLLNGRCGYRALRDV
jgi:hypothetical protein